MLTNSNTYERNLIAKVPILSLFFFSYATGHLLFLTLRMNKHCHCTCKIPNCSREAYITVKVTDKNCVVLTFHKSWITKRINIVYVHYSEKDYVLTCETYDCLLVCSELCSSYNALMYRATSYYYQTMLECFLHVISIAHFLLQDIPAKSARNTVECLLLSPLHSANSHLSITTASLAAFSLESCMKRTRLHYRDVNKNV